MEGVILELKEIYYLSNSFFNPVNRKLLNDDNIYHNNECETLYN